MNSIQDQIHKLEQEIEETSRFTHSNIDGFTQQLYQLKRKSLDDNRNYRKLGNMEEYLKYQSSKLDAMKKTILSIINLIFLPLGFMVGYFGMNFASMGNPDISNGILAMANAEWYLLGITMMMIFVTAISYQFYFSH